MAMNLDELNRVARAMGQKGKGILAADESSGTIKKRFDKIGVDSTEENRRDYREFLFRSKDGMKHISGVILYDETIRQKAKGGTPLVKLIEEAGSIPGIKVDKGAKPLPFSKDETITEGLDGLRERLVEYRGLGARFAKWRATYTPTQGRPSYNCINANGQALARYAALCQEENIVPIVAPEDMILKPNMVISGKKADKQASVEEVAERTVKVLKHCVPAAVPGIAFLSGGQADEEATAHLNAMNAAHPDLPWALTFSYGRALQAAPQSAWSGKADNVPAAQRAFAHRARMNGLATTGGWKSDLEKNAA